MNNYKSFLKLKKELGDNYDFKLYEMGISALKEIENLQQENKQLKEDYDRIYNENCKLREEHNINDISLLDENEKLKKEIDILLNVQEECEKSLYKIRELKKELNKVNEENKKLKEQIKIYEDPEDLTLIFMYCDIEAKDKIKELKKQQKEFIKYLEDEIKQNTPYLRWKHYNEDGFRDYDVENPCGIVMQPIDKIYKQILKKYKEIIGGNRYD